MNFCNLYYEIDSEIIVDLSTTCSREISRTNRECRAGCFDQMKSLPSFEMPQKIVLNTSELRSALPLPPVREQISYKDSFLCCVVPSIVCKRL